MCFSKTSILNAAAPDVKANISILYLEPYDIIQINIDIRLNATWFHQQQCVDIYKSAVLDLVLCVWTRTKALGFHLLLFYSYFWHITAVPAKLPKPASGEVKHGRKVTLPKVVLPLNDSYVDMDIACAPAHKS
jgi:hypothetical protein